MTFQMLAYSSTPAEWNPMEKAGGAKWKPKQTLIEAARQCLEWTGCIGIPAMQVIDLTTGDVVWRDSDQYPECGEPIRHEWDPALRAAVRQAYRDESQAALAADPDEPTLFDLP